MKWIAFSGGILVLGVVLVVLIASPGASTFSPTLFIALSNVGVPEMPAKAAELVSAALASQREQTAQDVLRAVSTMARLGVLPYVVSAVCHSSPEVAGVVVTTAIELEPDNILIFSKAAVCAAPNQVAEVVVAACKANPPSFANVALVASRQMPSANKLILESLIRVMPGLAPYLEKAQIQTDPNDFEAIIKQTAQLVTDAAKAQSK